MEKAVLVHDVQPGCATGWSASGVPPPRHGCKSGLMPVLGGSFQRSGRRLPLELFFVFEDGKLCPVGSSATAREHELPGEMVQADRRHQKNFRTTDHRRGGDAARAT